MHARTFRLPAASTPALLLVLACVVASPCGGCATGPHGAAGAAAAVARTADANAAVFARAAVASDHAVASAAGAEILAKGGNAVDAAVATSFALSVVRPYSCGIGGGGFMVIRFANHPRHGDVATAINYRETTPAAVGPDFYEALADPDASTKGATAAAVPGTVAGLLYALEKYGTLDRATVLAPAIRAAEEGFVVDAHYVHSMDEIMPWFRKDPARQRRLSFVWKRFLLEGKLKVGDRIRLPEQAEALRLIARDGADAFYRGPIADAIVRAVKRDGGVLSAADLASFRPREVAPLRYAALGRTFLSMPPPSSGGVTMAQTLEMLDRLQPRFASGPEDSPRRLHAEVEAMKHAFADRSRLLADPEFAEVPVDRMLAPAYVAAMVGRIAPTTRPSDTYGWGDRAVARLPDDGGTSHFSVVDAHGNAVACTETINLIFGSCLVVEEYGFALNNQMDDFTTRRGKPNAFKLVQSDLNLPEPGKRPLSSMSPTIVLDDRGRPMVVAGASGGPRIITGTMQAMLRVLRDDASAGEAVRAPRVHHQWQPDVLYAENGALTPQAKSWLEKAGHTVEPVDAVGNVQLIRRSQDGRGWDAACDPRKGGRPAGF